jgi:hypothetical protein
MKNWCTHSRIYARNVGQVFRVNLTFQVVILFQWFAVSNSRSAKRREQGTPWKFIVTGSVMRNWSDSCLLVIQRIFKAIHEVAFSHVKLNLDLPVIRVKCDLFIYMITKWIMNWKGYGMKWSRPFRRTIPAFAWRDLKTTTDRTVRPRRDSNRTSLVYKSEVSLLLLLLLLLL